MIDPDHPLAELLRRDRRYHRDAYFFVFEALRFAQEQLGLGGMRGAEASEVEEDLTRARVDGNRHRTLVVLPELWSRNGSP